MTRSRVAPWTSVRDGALDLLRVYVGALLVLRGADYVGNAADLLGTMRAASVPASSMMLVHYVALAHLGGGLLLALGLVTRLAAAAQIPAVLGAIVFVHRHESLFAPESSLRFALLVLALLAVHLVAGAGRFSLDAYLRAHDESSPAARRPRHARPSYV